MSSKLLEWSAPQSTYTSTQTENGPCPYPANNGRRATACWTPGSTEEGTTDGRTVLTPDAILPLDTSEHGIGKQEAHMALISLLGNDDWVTSLDITDEVAFQWTRFLRLQTWNRDVVGPGVREVVAARFDNCQPPTIVFCRSDNQYCVTTPGSKTFTTFDGWKTILW